MSMLRRSLAVTPLLALALAACSSDSSTEPSGPQPVTIRFAAQVGSQPFTCGQTYSGLGSPATTATPSDFMLYVSNVRLLTSSGAEVPVTLTPDNKFQADNVTLIDFAAGGAGTACANATTETNTQIVGTVPAGAYTGLRFELGLPFDKNHQDQTTATGPYSVSRMFWSWNAGYKAVRLDLTTGGFPTGWVIHLGSTGCTPTGTASTVPTACTAPNRPTITLTGFDATRDRVIADIAQLVATSNLNANLGGPAGCMSGTTDLDCAPLFTSFGLAFNGSAVPATQSFLRSARQ